MKRSAILKGLIILIIILICLISFLGIYKKDKGQTINLVPEYVLSMDLAGQREVILNVSQETEEIVYNSEGKVATDGLDEEGNLKEGYSKKNEKINKDEFLTLENYENCKRVIEKRLKALGASEYIVRQNKETGQIVIQIPENEHTDEIIGNLTYLGKFEIVDSQTQDVLLDNSYIKNSKPVYNTTEAGTTVYLSIEFNKEGKKKLEEITKTYIQTTDEEGNSVTKKVTINLDDEKLLETYFGETITTGVLQLTIGTASTENTTISNYIEQASQVASLITNNKMELHYDLDSNTYLQSLITYDDLKIVGIIAVTVIAILLIYLCIKYKVNGIFASISYIGFIGSILLVLRYTNVIISIEGIMGIIIILMVNYAFNIYMLNKIKDKNNKDIIDKSLIHYLWMLLPLLIISITFTFTSWLPVASIGMVMLWGLIVLFVYNYLVTKTLLEK